MIEDSQFPYEIYKQFISGLIIAITKSSEMLWSCFCMLAQWDVLYLVILSWTISAFRALNWQLDEIT